MNDERRVWIAQLKCPQNHCILAGANEYDTAEEAEALRGAIMRRFRVLVLVGRVDPWCWVCHAPSDRYYVHIARTPYRTLQEAEAPLNACAAEQAASAEFIRNSRN